MNEKSKIFVVFGAIIALFIVIIGYNISVSNNSKKVYDKFNSDLNSTEEKIVFIGREECSWCKLFRPIFDYYAKKYNISYNYIGTESLTSSDFQKVLDKLEVSSDDFGTPLVAFVKDGKSVDKISGYVNEKELFDILKNHGFISTEEKLALNYLDYSSIKKTISSKEKSVIVVGQQYCSHCIGFKPILMKVANEKSVKINYFNYDEIEEKEELDSYLEKFEVFQEEWGTPLTIVTQNGKIIDTLSGETTEDKVIEFLKRNDLIEG